MQLLTNQTSVNSDKIDDLHPVTLELPTRYGLLKFNSSSENCLGKSIVVATSSAQNTTSSLYFVEPTKYIEQAAEQLRKYLGLNRQNLLIGEVINCFPIAGTNVVTIVARILDKQCSYYAQYMGIDPYSAQSVVEAPKHRTLDVVVNDETATVHPIQA